MGSYFASESCKSHQYTCSHHKGGCDCKEIRIMLLARVALGDPYYATEVDKTLRRPPQREQSSRLYDSIIANPGPMAGHQRGYQDHQEFVIFDKAQAYPA